MVFQGLDARRRRRRCGSRSWTRSTPTKEWKVEFSPLKIVATSARTSGRRRFVKRMLGFIKQRRSARRAARPTCSGPATRGRRASSCTATSSTWLPAALLRAAAGAASWPIRSSPRAGTGASSLHLNKGLAGAPAEAVAAARDTAIEPGRRSMPSRSRSWARRRAAGVSGRGRPRARRRAAAAAHAQAIARAMEEMRKLVPAPAPTSPRATTSSRDWQEAFWGANYARLLAVKERYDPEGLFFVHHGAGSERWSADGFTRLR